MLPTVADAKLLDLRRIERPEGNITPIEATRDVPFEIARVYYLYDIPGGTFRGAHSHRELEQVIIAAMGAFDVVLDDGTSQRTVTLNRAYYGLYLPRLLWRDLKNFSSGSICLVLASMPYEETDYIREYDEFVQARNPPGRHL